MKRCEYEIQVKWSGKYPTLCYGKWIITIDGISLTGLDNEDFRTFNTYDNNLLRIQTLEEGVVVDCTYEDGLFFEKWLEELKTHDINGLYASLKKHGFNIEDVDFLEKLYNEIKSSDWRHNSCGGCW